MEEARIKVDKAASQQWKEQEDLHWKAGMNALIQASTVEGIMRT